MVDVLDPFAARVGQDVFGYRAVCRFIFELFQCRLALLGGVSVIFFP